MSTGFLSQNQAMLGMLRSYDSGSDEYRLFELNSSDIRYATTL